MCYNHDIGKDRCSIKQIPETEIYQAFIRMYNKLKKNSHYILTPLLDQLIALKSHGAMNNVRIVEINKEIAELTEQNLILNRLRSKGYMDSAIFMEQTNEINRKINSLRTTRRKMLEKDEDDRVIADTKNLITIIEDGTLVLTDFDELIFHSIVDKIIVESQEKIKFRLIGGLELAEQIQGSVR